MLPQTPEAARFDPEQNAWILSRHADVLAALREPRLVQASAQAKPSGIDPGAIVRQVQADLREMSSAGFQDSMRKNAEELIGRVRGRDPVDVVRAVVLPWSVSAMLCFAKPSMASADFLPWVSRALFYRSGDEPTGIFGSLRNTWRAGLGRIAEKGLDRLSMRYATPLSKPTFLGITQTLPAFIASAWHSLLQNPEQLAALSGRPELMPGACEELLRYAGIVQTLYRQAESDLQIGECAVRREQMVILKLSSANFDPERFPEPEKLDLTRKSTGQLALGGGPYACAAAALIRLVFPAITRPFIESRPTIAAGRPVKWNEGSTVRWPSSVFAFIGSGRS